MIKIISVFFACIITLSIYAGDSGSIFIEAESFQNKGGWVVDQQFMDLMGSSYPMAHGRNPVSDATTTVNPPRPENIPYLSERITDISLTTKEGPGKFH